MRNRSNVRGSFAWLVFALLANCAQDTSENAEARNSALCRSEPERLVQLPGRFTALAVGDDAIYLGKDAIYRLPKRAGAKLERFADSPATVRELAIHGDDIYWLAAGPLRAPASLLTASASKRKPALVHHDAGEAFGSNGRATLTTSEKFVVAVFEVEAGRQQVVRVEPGSDEANTFVEFEGTGPFELAADDDRVFVSGNGSVAAWDANGESHAIEHSGTKLIEDDEYLYWVEDETLLMRAPKDTLARERFAEVPIADHLELATDDSSPDIYWTDESGSITHLPKTAGASGLTATTGEYDDDDFDTLLAVDRTSVYWIGGMPGMRVSDDGALWLYRMCKAGDSE